MKTTTTYAKYTPEYRKGYAKEYNKTYYDSLLCKKPKRAKTQIRADAERRGMSMTSFVMEAVFKEIAEESI